MDIDYTHQLCILVHLARIDNDVAPEEKDLLYLIARQNQLPESFVDALLHKTPPYKIDTNLSYSAKFEILYNCVRLMLAGGIINQHEIDFCGKLSVEMGFSQEVIQFITDRFKSSKEELKDDVFQLAFAS